MDRYKDKNYIVKSNIQVARKTWRILLEGDTSDFTAPGQFVNIRVSGRYLRRPISVSDYDATTLTLLYDVVGAGTQEISYLKTGDKVNLLTGLGNGFDITVSGERPVLLGGGIGVAPMVNLAFALRSIGKAPVILLGFATGDDVSLVTEMREAGFETYVSTVDGSVGTKGFVTDALKENVSDFDYFYACGPMPMLKAICNTLPQPGQLSLEARMACGFGVCMCCSTETTEGPKRICKDGPIFTKEELSNKL